MNYFILEVNFKPKDIHVFNSLHPSSFNFTQVALQPSSTCSWLEPLPPINELAIVTVPTKAIMQLSSYTTTLYSTCSETSPHPTLSAHAEPKDTAGSDITWWKSHAGYIQLHGGKALTTTWSTGVGKASPGHHINITPMQHAPNILEGTVSCQLFRTQRANSSVYMYILPVFMPPICSWFPYVLSKAKYSSVTPSAAMISSRRCSCSVFEASNTE